jgi:hypothetical protein
MHHKGNVQATKLFQNSAPCPFLGKSGLDSAANLSGRSLFYSAPFSSYAAELSASWQHPVMAVGGIFASPSLYEWGLAEAPCPPFPPPTRRPAGQRPKFCMLWTQIRSLALPSPLSAFRVPPPPPPLRHPSPLSR